MDVLERLEAIAPPSRESLADRVVEREQRPRDLGPEDAHRIFAVDLGSGQFVIKVIDDVPQPEAKLNPFGVVQHDETGGPQHSIFQNPVDLDDSDGMVHLVVAKAQIFRRAYEQGSWYLDRALARALTG
mgnify:CR=1 FL=1